MSEGEGVVNLMDYGVSLGRRFRALKLWFVLRNYGVTKLQELIREHIRLAQQFADAPHGVDESALNALNVVISERVHSGRELYLSHTSVQGRYALRLAIGNEHTAEPHVRRAWAIIQQAAKV